MNLATRNPEKGSESRRTGDFERLLSELERLLRLDQAALSRQDYARLADNQKLKGDFIRKIAELSAEGVPAIFKDRIEKLYKAQTENASWLNDSMEANRDELASLLKGRRTVRRLNSSYGTTDRPKARRTNKSGIKPSKTRFISVA
ncbi:MAG: hypothetical protein ACPGN3_15190 [Opitutales bacterium]